MALKTFNLNAEIYKEFSRYCKKEGISMSKKLENFIREEVSKIQGKKLVKNNIPVKSEKSDLKPTHHSFSTFC